MTTMTNPPQRSRSIPRTESWQDVLRAMVWTLQRVTRAAPRSQSEGRSPNSALHDAERDRLVIGGVLYWVIVVLTEPRHHRRRPAITGRPFPPRWRRFWRPWFWTHPPSDATPPIRIPPRFLPFVIHRIRRMVAAGHLTIDAIGAWYEQTLEGELPSQWASQETRSRPNHRRNNGIYYTPPALVQSAIELGFTAVSTAAQECNHPAAVVSRCRILDPSCGSGNFLLAAARRVAAVIGQGGSTHRAHAAASMRATLRNVITTSIFGVDRDPVAVALCRVRLWAAVGDRTWSPQILESRIRCGNSIIGAPADVITRGIPDQAYLPVGDDHPEYCRAIRRRNEVERSGQQTLTETLITNTPSSASSPPASPWEIADLWCAAFVWRKDPHHLPPPTTADVRMAAIRRDAIAPEVWAETRRLACRYHFFHWHLAFPDIVRPVSAKDVPFGWHGGFDLVLGNPPWGLLTTTDNDLGDNELPVEMQQRERHFVRSSGLFRESSATPRINIANVFAELIQALRAPHGHAAVYLPTSLVTDVSMRHWFVQAMHHRLIAAVFDYRNLRLFPSVSTQFRFSFVLLAPHATTIQTTAALLDPAHLHRPYQITHLRPADLALVNPNTQTLPMFRSSIAAAHILAIYRRLPVMVETNRAYNPWGVSIEDAVGVEHTLPASSHAASSDLVPLYEAKLFAQYHHRWASYVPASSRLQRVDDAMAADPFFRITPRYWVSAPDFVRRFGHRWSRRWFLAVRDVTNAFNERTIIASMVPWSAVGNTANLILLPDTETVALSASWFIAALNSLVLDYVARNKIGGPHLTPTILKQLPFPPPAMIRPDLLHFLVPRVAELVATAWDIHPWLTDVWAALGTVSWGEATRAAIWRRWYEATGTPPPASPPATCPPPFPWLPDRRALVRAELDAAIAWWYGLSYDDLRCILAPAEQYGDDAPEPVFRVLQLHEQQRLGTFRTRDLTLAAWHRVVPLVGEPFGMTAAVVMDTATTSTE